MYGNEANLKDALFKFKDLMDERGIDFVLVKGTLLGAYRNNRLLPWDEDIDVEIIFKSYEDFVNSDMFGLLRDAYKKGFRQAGWGHEFKADTEFIQYPEISSLPDTQQWTEFLKMDPKWKDELCGMCWHGTNPSIELLKARNGWVHIDCFISIKDIHESYPDGQLDKIMLYNNVFNIPPNTLNYLLTNYGDWQTIFCSTELWVKYDKLIRNGYIPQEVTEFMNKWKTKLECEQ